MIIWWIFNYIFKTFRQLDKNGTKMVWRNYLCSHLLLTLKSQQCTWHSEEVRPLASEFITRAATKMVKKIPGFWLVQFIMFKLSEEVSLSIRNRVLHHSALNLPSAFRTPQTWDCGKLISVVAKSPGLW